MLNATPDTAQNYRGLLLAKVTAKNTPGSGVFSGVPLYDWTEQTFDPVTGVSQAAVPARKGAYVSASQFSNCLLDANNRDITLNTYVWIRMKGAVAGQTIYETVAAPSSSSPGYRMISVVPSYPYSITTDGAMHATGQTITIPKTASYLLTINTVLKAKVSNLGGFDGALVYLQMTLDGVTFNDLMPIGNIPTINKDFYLAWSISVATSFNSAGVVGINLGVRAGATWTTADLVTIGGTYGPSNFGVFEIGTAF